MMWDTLASIIAIMLVWAWVCPKDFGEWFAKIYLAFKGK